MFNEREQIEVEFSAFDAIEVWEEDGRLRADSTTADADPEPDDATAGEWEEWSDLAGALGLRSDGRRRRDEDEEDELDDDFETEEDEEDEFEDDEFEEDFDEDLDEEEDEDLDEDFDEDDEDL
jgi:hypothetical protein